jgi:uncharacterized membrane protein YphA (DoxX/SURF4 family)
MAWVGRRLIDIVMVVLVVAGLAKTIGIDDFATHVARWHVLAPGMAYPLAIAVISAELACGLGWLLRLAPRTSLAGAVAFIAAATLVFWLISRSGAPPHCGCFGVLERYYEGLNAATSVVRRNGIMLAALVVGGWLEYGRRKEISAQALAP